MNSSLDQRVIVELTARQLLHDILPLSSVAHLLHWAQHIVVCKFPRTDASTKSERGSEQIVCASFRTAIDAASRICRRICELHQVDPSKSSDIALPTAIIHVEVGTFNEALVVESAALNNCNIEIVATEVSELRPERTSDLEVQIVNDRKPPLEIVPSRRRLDSEKLQEGYLRLRGISFRRIAIRRAECSSTDATDQPIKYDGNHRHRKLCCAVFRRRKRFAQVAQSPQYSGTDHRQCSRVKVYVDTCFFTTELPGGDCLRLNSGYELEATNTTFSGASTNARLRGNGIRIHGCCTEALFRCCELRRGANFGLWAGTVAAKSAANQRHYGCQSTRLVMEECLVHQILGGPGVVLVSQSASPIDATISGTEVATTGMAGIIGLIMGSQAALLAGRGRVTIENSCIHHCDNDGVRLITLQSAPTPLPDGLLVPTTREPTLCSDSGHTVQLRHCFLFSNKGVGVFCDTLSVDTDCLPGIGKVSILINKCCIRGNGKASRNQFMMPLLDEDATLDREAATNEVDHHLRTEFRGALHLGKDVDDELLDDWISKISGLDSHASGSVFGVQNPMEPARVNRFAPHSKAAVELVKARPLTNTAGIVIVNRRPHKQNHVPTGVHSAHCDRPAVTVHATQNGISGHDVGAVIVNRWQGNTVAIGVGDPQCVFSHNCCTNNRLGVLAVADTVESPFFQSTAQDDAAPSALPTMNTQRSSADEMERALCVVTANVMANCEIGVSLLAPTEALSKLVDRGVPTIFNVSQNTIYSFMCHGIYAEDSDTFNSLFALVQFNCILGFHQATSAIFARFSEVDGSIRIQNNQCGHAGNMLSRRMSWWHRLSAKEGVVAFSATQGVGTTSLQATLKLSQTNTILEPTPSRDTADVEGETPQLTGVIDYGLRPAIDYGLHPAILVAGGASLVENWNLAFQQHVAGLKRKWDSRCESLRETISTLLLPSTERKLEAARLKIVKQTKIVDDNVAQLRVEEKKIQETVQTTDPRPQLSHEVQQFRSGHQTTDQITPVTRLRWSLARLHQLVADAALRVAISSENLDREKAVFRMCSKANAVLCENLHSLRRVSNSLTESLGLASEEETQRSRLMIDNTTQLAIESASIISSHCQKLQDLEHRVRSSFAEMAQLQPGIDDSSSRALELCMNNTVWSLLNFVKRRQRTFEPLDISTVAQECERIESFMQMLESEATISVISSDKWRNVVRETLTHIADSVHTISSLTGDSGTVASPSVAEAIIHLVMAIIPHDSQEQQEHYCTIGAAFVLLFPELDDSIAILQHMFTSTISHSQIDVHCPKDGLGQEVAGTTIHVGRTLALSVGAARSLVSLGCFTATSQALWMVPEDRSLDSTDSPSAEQGVEAKELLSLLKPAVLDIDHEVQSSNAPIVKNTHKLVQDIAISALQAPGTLLREIQVPWPAVTRNLDDIVSLVALNKDSHVADVFRSLLEVYLLVEWCQLTAEQALELDANLVRSDGQNLSEQLLLKLLSAGIQDLSFSAEIASKDNATRVVEAILHDTVRSASRSVMPTASSPSVESHPRFSPELNLVPGGIILDGRVQMVEALNISKHCRAQPESWGDVRVWKAWDRLHRKYIVVKVYRRELRFLHVVRVLRRIHCNKTFTDCVPTFSPPADTDQPSRSVATIEAFYGAGKQYVAVPLRQKNRPSYSVPNNRDAVLLPDLREQCFISAISESDTFVHGVLVLPMGEHNFESITTSGTHPQNPAVTEAYQVVVHQIAGCLAHLDRAGLLLCAPRPSDFVFFANRPRDIGMKLVNYDDIAILPSTASAPKPITTTPSSSTVQRAGGTASGGERECAPSDENDFDDPGSAAIAMDGDVFISPSSILVVSRPPCQLLLLICNIVECRVIEDAGEDGSSVHSGRPCQIVVRIRFVSRSVDGEMSSGIWWPRPGAQVRRVPDSCGIAAGKPLHDTFECVVVLTTASPAATASLRQNIEWTWPKQPAVAHDRGHKQQHKNLDAPAPTVNRSDATLSKSQADRAVTLYSTFHASLVKPSDHVNDGPDVAVHAEISHDIESLAFTNGWLAVKQSPSRSKLLRPPELHAAPEHLLQPPLSLNGWTLGALLLWSLPLVFPNAPLVKIQNDNVEGVTEFCAFLRDSGAASSWHLTHLEQILLSSLQHETRRKSAAEILLGGPSFSSCLLVHDSWLSEELFTNPASLYCGSHPGKLTKSSPGLASALKLINMQREILEVEESYLRNIQAIVSYYASPARAILADEPDSASILERLFGNVDVVVALHTKLLAQMLHHHSQRPQVGHTSLSGLIAAFYSVFGTDLAKLRDTYTAFAVTCASYESTLKWLSESARATSSLFSSFSDTGRTLNNLQKLLKHPQQFFADINATPSIELLPLDDYFNRPMQQISRYPLIFSRITKMKIHSNGTRHRLQELCRKLSHVTQHVNRAVGTHRVKQKLSALCDNLIDTLQSGLAGPTEEKTPDDAVATAGDAESAAALANDAPVRIQDDGVDTLCPPSSDESAISLLKCFKEHLAGASTLNEAPTVGIKFAVDNAGINTGDAASTS